MIEKYTCSAPDHTPVTQLSLQMDSTGQDMTSNAGNKGRKDSIKAAGAVTFGEMCV